MNMTKYFIFKILYTAVIIGSVWSDGMMCAVFSLSYITLHIFRASSSKMQAINRNIKYTRFYVFKESALELSALDFSNNAPPPYIPRDICVKIIIYIICASWYLFISHLSLRRCFITRVCAKNILSKKKIRCDKYHKRHRDRARAYKSAASVCETIPKNLQKFNSLVCDLKTWLLLLLFDFAVCDHYKKKTYRHCLVVAPNKL